MPLPALTPARLALFGQFVRYVVTGGLVTAIGALVYWGLATRAGVTPLVANVLAFLVMLTLGFVGHSRWSFGGHARGGEVARTTSRFFAVSLVGLGLSSAWVWLLTGILRGPAWWPIVPMLFVTPVAVFWLNRRFVFGVG